MITVVVDYIVYIWFESRSVDNIKNKNMTFCRFNEHAFYFKISLLEIKILIK